MPWLYLPCQIQAESFAIINSKGDARDQTSQVYQNVVKILVFFNHKLTMFVN